MATKFKDKLWALNTIRHCNKLMKRINPKTNDSLPKGSKGKKVSIV